ncbi:pyridoxal phosphate-dependent aminotransferase [Sinorhizobium meliloti]|uniref:pyridoxal phosphate-dependent aminotransferase n=1 Tax=Rhizobium meliloti TaxID=382 RepID=UPI00129585B1|nr:aminotransferase class I/II-fold pyridoxal phosphate-dependent enzyme [Sinorhizobium meliloti]
MTVISKRLGAVKPSATKAMTAKARELKELGKSIIALSAGEPDFDTPENVKNAGIDAIRSGKTKYTPVPGIAPLLKVIQEKFECGNNLHYDSNQITTACGAKQILFNALFATLDPGDEVIIPAPCWVSYPDMVRLAGGSPVIISCCEADGFKLTPEAFEKQITRRTRWLMLNSPSNPTGAVYTGDELRALAEVLRNHPHVMVLADDIYEKLVYGEAKFATIAAVAPWVYDRTLTVNGVSKANAMTGWRLGYGAGPADLIKAMNTIQGQTASHTSSISQYAAVEAIGGDQSYLPVFVKQYKARRDLVVRKLNEAYGVRCGAPDGAFYVFASCEGLIGRRVPSGQVLKTDDDVAMFLLEHAGVAVVPGSGFLMSPYFRISYASSEAELTEACDRIIAACEILAKGEAA